MALPEPEPEAERQAPILLPPLLLRRRVRGAPTWMLPRYLVHDVDLYRYHPQVLLRLNPSATSPDGKRACYFLNLVRPLSATDSRRSRVVPGGFWKSERAPVPVEAAPDRIVGSKQTFSFVSKGGEDKDGLHAGFIMQELVLPGQAGRLAGGDELALSRVYPTPRINKKTPQGQRSTSSARSSAPASSPPAAPDLLHRRPVSAPSSSPPPLWQAPASSLALHGTASSASGPSSSSQPPIQGQGGARRVLLLEVGDSPPREGKTLSFQRVYQATELVGPGKRVSIDCGDMFLLDTGNGEKIGYLPRSIRGFANLPLSRLASQNCHPVHVHFVYHAISPFSMAFLFLFHFLTPERTKVPLMLSTRTWASNQHKSALKRTSACCPPRILCLPHL